MSKKQKEEEDKKKKLFFHFSFPSIESENSNFPFFEFWVKKYIFPQSGHLEEDQKGAEIIKSFVLYLTQYPMDLSTL